MNSSLTLEEIAKLARVSRSTVSRVINDQPNVREPVRERVWQVIRETGYQPHAAARSLVTRRTRIVGVIIPEAITTLFTQGVRGREPLGELLQLSTSICSNLVEIIFHRFRIKMKHKLNPDLN